MRTLRDRRGAIAAASAVLMIVILGFAGLAIDVTRIWMVNARLKTAIDAASLVAARQITLPTAERDAQVQAVYWANFSQNGRNYNYLGATVTDAVITPIPGQETRRIQVSGQAIVPTTLFSIIQRTNTTVMDSAIAERQGTGMELAIAIDQTSSMNGTVNGITKIELARRATTGLLDILYGTNDTNRNLFVSIVPFARTINIGTANLGVLDTRDMPASWNSFSNRWAGCVEARRGGHDITDSAPITNDQRIPPYYWDTTFRQVGWVNNDVPNSAAMRTRNQTAWRAVTGVNGYEGNNLCASSEAYAAVPVTLFTADTGNAQTTYNVRFCRGANDWRDLSNTANPTVIRTLSNSTSSGAYNPMYATLFNLGFTGNGFTQQSAAGPNTLCAMTPMLPLTASRQTVQNRVNEIVAPIRSGGTTVVAGMQGLWYNLSPNWRGQWAGIGTSTEFGTLPLEYRVRNMLKIAVILTDGDNNWQPPYSLNSRTVRDSVQGANWFTDLMYNAYGRRSDFNANVPGATIGTGSNSTAQQNNADAQLDARFRAICQAMKDEDIMIYVVGLEVTQGSAIDTMLAGCATSSRTYIRAQTAAQLGAAFTEVANQIASLRLVQ